MAVAPGTATIWLGLWTLALLPITVVIYRLFLHPLARIPGPKVAAISRLWQAQQYQNGRLFAVDLHRKYGPVVRIAPNEVIFDSAEAFHELYRAASSFRKSSWYQATKAKRGKVDWLGKRHAPADTLDLLPESNMERYRMQRRAFGPVYSASNMKKYESVIDGCLARISSKLRSLDEKQVDLTEWIHILAFECLCAVTLSSDLNWRQNGTDGGSMIASYFGFWRQTTVVGLFPGVLALWDYAPKLRGLSTFMMGLRSSRQATQSPWPHVMKALKAHLTSDEIPSAISDAPGSLLEDLLQVHKMKPEFQQEYATNMAMTNFGAGHDTIAASVIAILVRICQRPDVLKRVTQELAQSQGPSRQPEQSRPYLNACIREALRLHPVTGISLSRVVPEGGLQLHGYWFPPGTTVGCNAYALHRNKDIFGEDADEFKPERWLEGIDRGDPTKTMDRVSLVWGGASRTCPGRHLAELIIWRTVPALLEQFDIDVSVPTTSFDDMPYYFLAVILGVKAVFRPKESTSKTEKDLDI